MFAGAIKAPPGGGGGGSVPPATFRHRAGNCILVTIAVICVCILVSCGVLIVREYALDMSYGPSICVVANVTYTPNRYMPCTHCSVKEKNKQKGKGACKEVFFPCVQVLVNYSADGRRVQGRLHPDSLHARGQFKQCSYSVCLKTKEQNNAKVDEFAQQWRDKTGHRFECFYNTDDHSSVIATKNHTKAQVVHSMLWPSLVILVCGAIFLRLEMNRRHLTFCGVQGDEEFMNKVNARTSRDGNNQAHGGAFKQSQTDVNDGLLKQQGSPSHCRASLEQIPLNSNVNINNTSNDNLSNGSRTHLDKVSDPTGSSKMGRTLEATLTDGGGVTHKVVKSPNTTRNAHMQPPPKIVVDPSSTCS